MRVVSKGVTPDRFAAVMRRLETVAPGELNTAMENIARVDVLPGARAKAGGGQLSASLRVVKGPELKGPAVKSPLVYAWAQHGSPQPGAANSQTWWAVSRVGRGKRPPGPGIPKKLFVSSQFEGNATRINHDIGQALDRMMLKHLGGSA